MHKQLTMCEKTTITNLYRHCHLSLSCCWWSVSESVLQMKSIVVKESLGFILVRIASCSAYQASNQAVAVVVDELKSSYRATSNPEAPSAPHQLFSHSWATKDVQPQAAAAWRALQRGSLHSLVTVQPAAKTCSSLCWCVVSCAERLWCHCSLGDIQACFRDMMEALYCSYVRVYMYMLTSVEQEFISQNILTIQGQPMVLLQKTYFAYTTLNVYKVPQVLLQDRRLCKPVLSIT